MAKIGYDMSDVIIMTADNPRSEKVEDILSDMNKGVDSLPQDSKVYMIADRREAIACAYGLAKSGDYILLAGKGHEKYQEMDGKRVHFDDMEEIKKLML
jgi:UDP-N-acetylmuramoyl-L-alanyl-D-glutamate--2,6-diaminopimelate ligase